MVIMTITAPELLERAAGHMRDRAATYDKPEGERSMGKTVAAFNAVTGRDLSEAEGWLLLDILKQVRLFQRPGYHADSAEDHIAYAALMAEAKAREVQPGATAFPPPCQCSGVCAPDCAPVSCRGLPRARHGR